mmetsp:Transcript_29975/g.63177  ORF Transcript_29975/g.63177 Transcript_29975/m.63177 type:complete len:426 (-) Transcript_29975:3-1280(-)
MSTNPFDDDPLPSPPSHPIGGAGRSTNPFGDDEHEFVPGSGGGGGGSGGMDAPPMPYRNNHNSSSGVGGDRAHHHHHPYDATTTTHRGGGAPLNSGAMSRSSFIHSNTNAHAFGGPSAPTSSPSSNATNGESSSWQDLGDLPYRRVRLYDDVRWGRLRRKKKKKKTRRNGNDNPNPAEDEEDEQQQQQQQPQSNEERFGLAFYPKSYVDTVRSHQSAVLGPSGGGHGEASISRLLSTTTTTLVAGCPNSGPVTSVTVPLVNNISSGSSSSSVESGFGSRATIRVMNNSGTILSAIDFPPRDLALTVHHHNHHHRPASSAGSTRVSQHRSPGDILSIGFTSRCVLIIVLRDSLTLCYDLGGRPVLPPFFALPHNNMAKGRGMDLLAIETSVLASALEEQKFTAEILTFEKECGAAAKENGIKQIFS